MRINRFIRVILFAILFVILFLLLRCIMLPKWNYPQFADNVSYSVSTFFRQERNTDDVVFLGTSHTAYAVSPMEIYKKSSLISYNLGTSLQGILETYSLLRKTLEEQKPKVIVLDVSSLFFSSPTNDIAWEYLKTSLTSIKDTAELVLSHFIEDNQKTPMNPLVTSEFWGFWDQVLSTQYLNSRWKELGYSDFRDTFFHNYYYTAGYFLCPVCVAAQGTEYMNKLAEEIASDIVSHLYEYEDNMFQSKEENNPLYVPKISDENARILGKIAELCNKAGSELLLVKYPVINNPVSYSSSWTKIKSEYMKKFAERNDYKFLDLLYDVDLNIDLSHDYIDGGVHLNYNGAKKVSSYLGQYLMDHYSLTERQFDVYDDNMPMYDTLTELTDLMLETDLSLYLSKLRERASDTIICMAASDDVSAGLNDQVIDSMSLLGLQSDFNKTLGIRDSFISIIDGGDVLYEGISNRKMIYEKDLPDKMKMHIAITSSGRNTGATASIIVNGTEYACNSPGLNIVVIDKKTGMVIDSVVFNISVEEHTCIHRDSLTLLDEYWMELMRMEGKIC